MPDVKRKIWKLEISLVTVDIVERFKQELIYGLSSGTKDSGCCGDMAVSGG